MQQYDVESPVRIFNGPDTLGDFWSSRSPAALWPRSAPAGFEQFASQLAERGPWSRRTTLAHLQAELCAHLGPELCDRFWAEPWLKDVMMLSALFVGQLGIDEFCVSLDTDRPCQRFHADNLPLRLVSAYLGAGTLYLRPDNVNRQAASAKGTSNDEIVLRPQEVQQAGPWDVLLMKGKKAPGEPLYHRSPSPDASGAPSLLLKLDTLL